MRTFSLALRSVPLVAYSLCSSDAVRLCLLRFSLSPSLRIRASTRRFFATVTDD